TMQLVEFEDAMDSIDVSMSDIVDKPGADDINKTPDLEEESEEIVEEYTPDLLGSADLYDHAGDIYFRCGEVNRAVEFWQKALERKPEDPELIKAKIKHRKIIENAP
ncbi:MAG: tetratricopeptide repeat protein, partial [Muribaculaceae bacterium]|nr:tetratricopeptide repeat protein [Muribaculaceae bacterium]